MKLINEGKTKKVYDPGDGTLVLKINDAVTGDKDGKENPGGNQVVGERVGMGQAALAMSSHYFKLLEEKGIATHYISSDVESGEMKVRKTFIIGGNDGGIEFIRRWKATGSFMRRFKKMRFTEGQYIDITEITLKDDDAGDPPLTPQILYGAGWLDWYDEIDVLYELFEKACEIIRDDLASIGLELWDIKLELGYCISEEGEKCWMIIDDIGPGNMRVYKDGEKLDKLKLAELVLLG
jgi:phosphoribosylaminoimidazole-succinocarboxamide synthase